MPSRLNYDQLYQSFRWTIPARYNIAADVCDRHARDPGKVALIGVGDDGKTWEMTFREVQRKANQLANLLVSLGLVKGDRVMLLLGQNAWTAIGHVACWKAGLISVPASTLFGADAITYRLNTVGVRIVITDAANLPTVEKARLFTPAVEHVFLVDGAAPNAPSLPGTLETARDSFENVDTAADDPAFLNFTSGTTGNPKGALQAHRSMLGHLPGIELGLDSFPQPGDCMWSPADWAWLAGLMDVLMPAWFHGVPVLTFRAPRFDPEQAFAMMGRHRVRTALLTPTMLRVMRQIPDPVKRYSMDLRAIISGGESVGKDLHEWANDTLGAPVNEMFGQTECNLVLGSSRRIMPIKPGALGRAIPGHVAGIVDDDGRPLPTGDIGNLAFRSPDPVMMLEYWQNPEATWSKYADGWLITGDLARCDEDGYFWFHGRADDVITSAGYRIGPSEIEDALARHPAVVMAAVVGVPDPVRTESIKAFIVLKEGISPSQTLVENVRDFVRDHLAKHEVPRDIEFVSALPTTTTGKILRRELRDIERTKAAANRG
ncbi:AMP-binding protein [Bradyrhizobium sp.]|uniref:AMP-binding protein n=1 Tax=Bradyrhizobium sp. TaxID=376 RepID=UPI0025C30438|nr:AMP-binding protein [Bradyrhizobium sp.]